MLPVAAGCAPLGLSVEDKGGRTASLLPLNHTEAQGAVGRFHCCTTSDDQNPLQEQKEVRAVGNLSGQGAAEIQDPRLSEGNHLLPVSRVQKHCQCTLQTPRTQGWWCPGRRIK